MGRPRREDSVIIHQVKLWLIPGEDDDLIDFMATLPERGKAAAVKAAMRGGIVGNALTDEAEDVNVSAFDALLL